MHMICKLLITSTSSNSIRELIFYGVAILLTNFSCLAKDVSHYCLRIINRHLNSTRDINFTNLPNFLKSCTIA
ncbi:hypothetical protein T09_11210 [Trichinella sp. T9]|uniref:Uncharacterized protein n=1 Tax=Trichinella murrelli TaxID=144512 RepID=A0A0V0TJM5_9BILA|nr:hypothetical protein T05_767 [Trichinella murrelli]KRX63222.1 hypothetical protein T09_11210 [Trichinella sp. T9]